MKRGKRDTTRNISFSISFSSTVHFVLYVGKYLVFVMDSEHTFYATDILGVETKCFQVESSYFKYTVVVFGLSINPFFIFNQSINHSNLMSFLSANHFSISYSLQSILKVQYVCMQPNLTNCCYSGLFDGDLKIMSNWFQNQKPMSMEHKLFYLEHKLSWCFIQINFLYFFIFNFLKKVASQHFIQ